MELRQKLDTDYAARQQALSENACRGYDAARRVEEPFDALRPHFVADTERILNCRYFNRYADKTQAFSLYRNDDITRRILHVQIVSRIARNAGGPLKLNQDLIEAISLGHDLGHAPFGHAGERFLSALLAEHTGKCFRHNAHSVRILDKIFKLNLTLQTLDGILCHNGRMAEGEYRPEGITGGDSGDMFRGFDKKYEAYCDGAIPKDGLIASTLEGCVVRISDIIAYLGKDRQDAAILGIKTDGPLPGLGVGGTDSAFVTEIIENMVENSYGRDYIKLDETYSKALAREKKVNYHMLYSRQNYSEPYITLEAMFGRMYGKLLEDAASKNENSPIFRHHVNKIFGGFENRAALEEEYRCEEPNQLVADYMASMTDDYFIDLHEYLFPGVADLSYISYFPRV